MRACIAPLQSCHTAPASRPPHGASCTHASLGLRACRQQPATRQRHQEATCCRSATSAQIACPHPLPLPTLCNQGASRRRRIGPGESAALDSNGHECSGHVLQTPRFRFAHQMNANMTRLLGIRVWGAHRHEYPPSTQTEPTKELHTNIAKAPWNP
jgi:hypothetical protein